MARDVPGFRVGFREFRIGRKRIMKESNSFEEEIVAVLMRIVSVMKEVNKHGIKFACQWSSSEARK